MNDIPLHFEVQKGITMENQTHSNGFAAASLILGVLALLSAFTMTIFPPILLGALSIILGILSRGNVKGLSGNALIGIVTASSALVINLAICTTSFYTFFHDPALQEQVISTVNETYEQLFGMDVSEFWESYGISPNLNE